MGDLIPFGEISLEPAAIGSQGNAVLGIRDSGKTYTATALAERFHDAGIPFVAFDPVGVWRNLRVPGPGKAGRGYPVVVAGGVAGDLPITPDTCEAIVRAAMVNGVSLVIDLFDMHLSKADWRKIVMRSVRVLLHENEIHGLRHVFIEEAAEFAPQKVIDGHVYAEIEKLARMGGNARLGYTLINQRAEEVNKAVLELCDNLFLHRQKGRNSLTALSKWLNVGQIQDARPILESLPTLPNGECWAWLAGSVQPVHVHVPAKRSAHPDRRTMRADDFRGARPPVDVRGFVDKMKADLAPPAPGAPGPADVNVDVGPLIAAAEERGYRRGCEEASAEAFMRGRLSVVTHLQTIVERELKELKDEALTAPPAPATVQAAMSGLSVEEVHRAAPYPRRAAQPAVKASEKVETAAVATSAATDKASQASVSAGGKALLTALAWWAAAGHPSPTRIQLAAVAGLSPKSSTLRARLSELNQADLVTYPEPGRVSFTGAGVQFAHQFATPDVSVPLLTHVRQQLGAGALAVFNALVDETRAITRAELAARCGLEANSSTIRARLSELRQLELVTYPSPGSVELQAWVRG